MKSKEVLAAIAEGAIKVKSLEECATADLHLCAGHRTGLKGEMESVCSECGKPVFFTTAFPEGRQPRKICIQCAASHARGEESLTA